LKKYSKTDQEAFSNVTSHDFRRAYVEHNMYEKIYKLALEDTSKKVGHTNLYLTKNHYLSNKAFVPELDTFLKNPTASNVNNKLILKNTNLQIHPSLFQDKCDRNLLISELETALSQRKMKF
jgi:hypothetical protein